MTWRAAVRSLNPPGRMCLHCEGRGLDYQPHLNRLVPDDPSAAAWQAAVAGITALNREVAGLVDSLTEEQLVEPIAAGRVTRWQVIQALIVHNGHHTCSVISARVLGLWNA